ncbi:MAG: hypothetical protein ACXWXA_08160 [Candidatus Limnocylindrales bacterium]
MARLIVVVERALGPGVDFELGPRGSLVGRRVRAGGPWVGFDQAALLDSDDGSGRRVPVVVALPISTFAGCRLEVELIGGWETSRGSILVARLAGAPVPMTALARVAGNVDDGTWFDAATADRTARRARQLHRERRSHDRIAEGRAWQPSGALPPEIARFGTPHSAAEYSLAKLPPRFVRGLEGLLDDDERVLYWLERPLVRDLGVVRRLRGRTDRRAALLALTDRQVLWIVDHAQPDRQLSDWGVDVEIVPTERVLAATLEASDAAASMTLVTSAGDHRFAMPAELRRELEVMVSLVTRFTPGGAGSLPRRRYPLEPIGFDAEEGASWNQQPDARALYAEAARVGRVLGFLFSPRRPGQHLPSALVLRESAIEVRDQAGCRTVAIAEVRAISITLSPLVGRVAFGPGVSATIPAPTMDRGAGFVRLARRAVASAG